jgi:type VI secretion system protein ImpK
VRLVDIYTDTFYFTTLQRGLDFLGFDYQKVARRYDELLGRAEKAARNAGYSGAQWRESCLAVCAFIDESLLCSAWECKAEWQAKPLQLRYFDTTKAGELFYARLERLDPDDHEVREVFDYCLALGFRGKFHAMQHKESVERAIGANLHQFHGQQEVAYPDVLFPAAYREGQVPRRESRVSIESLMLLGLAALPVMIAILVYGVCRLRLVHLLAP